MKKKNTYDVLHILVNQKFEAEDILLKLNEGKSFSDLARQFSTCPSAKNGGALGPIPEGKADPDFETAALALKPGQRSDRPVRSRFGYHLIERLS